MFLSITVKEGMNLLSRLSLANSITKLLIQAEVMKEQAAKTGNKELERVSGC